MEGVTYITSMGLGVVIKTEKTMKENGGTFIVTNLPPQIKKVFDIVAALPAMKIFQSIEEADAYLLRMQQEEQSGAERIVFLCSSQYSVRTNETILGILVSAIHVVNISYHGFTQGTSTPVLSQRSFAASKVVMPWSSAQKSS